ncbi:hypothetical protein WICMUC_001394 [Wickerhamomyces mucosus]|uniref:SET domain-containing protein n=1 Tax=Wickerhamomyces mucosus TaxID=1378264 RepID=A0A9P8PU09_9ASCO|nr:hypothetical protein WICMUC_001394 [Wickerhamomyces mucosus]
MTIETEPTNIKISQLFDIMQTQYGRACFATQDILAGTNVLITNAPFGSVVLYEFRKEVCSCCYRYKYGEYCKIKLTQSNPIVKKRKFHGAGLWFCSEDCLNSYQNKENIDQLIETFDILLEHYQIKAKNPIDHEEFNPKISQQYIESYWKDIEQWEHSIANMKKTKAMNQIPYLNDDEYTSARFVAQSLFNTYQTHESLLLYHNLQSNELQKISKFPILLKSQTLIYKFLKILLPEFLQPLLTTTSMRLLFGREYGNSFGIWQIIEDERDANENKEFLGYMLFPEASFFNHSCSPNVRKFRKGNRMYFETTQDITKGQQLCIDYFHILDEPFQERQKLLSTNWFFDCACERCVLNH